MTFSKSSASVIDVFIFIPPTYPYAPPLSIIIGVIKSLPNAPL